MNKLLFILALAAFFLAIFFPLQRAFSPKGGVANCTQECGLFLGDFSLTDEFSTNLTASFSVPWGLTLAFVSPGGIPREGELWVRVTEPDTQELCLERLVAFRDAESVKVFGGEPALGLPFTFILENEEDVRKIDPVNGPFFISEGQKGVLPGHVYAWEIGVRSPGASFRGSLWLTAREVGGRSAFLGRYTKLLAALYAFFFALIIVSLVWLWHAGSLYRFVRRNVSVCLLVLAFGALGASGAKLNPSLTCAWAASGSSPGASCASSSAKGRAGTRCPWAATAPFPPAFWTPSTRARSIPGRGKNAGSPLWAASPSRRILSLS